MASSVFHLYKKRNFIEKWAGKEHVLHDVQQAYDSRRWEQAFVDEGGAQEREWNQA